jgi:glyoxylase-like metal-dependent hydrolase (beta-lactamase superfamily II)
MEIVHGVNMVKVAIPNNPLGFLNCYLVEGKDGWLMIDTGWNTHEALDALQAGLRELGLAFTDITTIVVTHVHPDHFGLAGKLKQLSPHTRLLAHHWEGALIESRYIKFTELQRQMGLMLRRYGVPELEIPSLLVASMPAMEFVTITMPDEYLYGGEIITTGLHNLEVIWTPGHSPGHICLYEPELQLLFAGDHILPQITPNISYHVQSGDNPLGDYINALQKLRNLPVTRVLPAHEHIFTDLQARIDVILRHHQFRKEEILRIFGDKTKTAYHIATHVRWAVPGLEYMRREGSITRINENNLFSYRAIVK